MNLPPSPVRSLVAGSALLSLLVLTSPAQEAPAFKADWNSGVRVESTDGSIKIKMGGRLMHDWLFADSDDALGPIEDGSEFRRVRFYTSGTLYERVDFKLQFDWASGDADLKDAYIALRGLPVGKLQIGHFYEPFALSSMISSKYYTFMENAPSVNAFSPVRNNGAMILDHAMDERVTWNLGAFRDADNQGKSTDEDKVSFTGRLTTLPVYADGGRRLVHLGVSGGYRNLDGTARFRARPAHHLAPYLVDTRSSVTDPDSGESTPVDIDGDDSWIYAVEAAATLDAFSLMGELTGSTVERTSGDRYDAMGWFIQASYFLTGEHRPYKKSSGRFVGVTPNKNYGKDGGGAWEVAARYGTLDLNDGDVAGGEMDNTTLGINWYLNPAVRIMLNYDYADVANQGDAHLVGTRFQVAF